MKRFCSILHKRNYRPMPWIWSQYILLRVAFLITLTIILTWFYNRSGRSIQTAALFHASMNTTPYVLSYYPPRGR